MVEIFHQTAHPLNLSVQIRAFGLFLSETLLAFCKVILESLFFILDQSELLLEIDNLQLGFVLEILVFQSLILAFVQS